MLAIDIWKVFELLKTLEKNRTFTELFSQAFKTCAFTSSPMLARESNKANDANLIAAVQET